MNWISISTSCDRLAFVPIRDDIINCVKLDEWHVDENKFHSKALKLMTALRSAEQNVLAESLNPNPNPPSVAATPPPATPIDPDRPVVLDSSPFSLRSQ